MSTNQRFALVVGIDHYDAQAWGGNIDLQMAVHDAQRVLLALPEGVETTYIVNEQATMANVKGALVDIISRATPGDEIWFYFSGHGTYWDMPAGRKTARCMHDRPWWDHDIAFLLKKSPAGLIFRIFSDCCYAEGNNRSFHEVPPGIYQRRCVPCPNTMPPQKLGAARNIQRVAAPHLLIIGSCNIKQTSVELHEPFADLPAGGVFTSWLLKTLESKGDIPYSNMLSAYNKTFPKVFPQKMTLEYVKALNLKYAPIWPQ